MRSFPGQPSAEAAPDVVVVGAGIIGCSVAYHLSFTGRKVLVVERDHVGAGASHVAPGMLAPQVEAHYDDAFFALTLKGRSVHAPLAEELRDRVGLDVGYRPTGVVRVAIDEAERTELRRRLTWQQARDLRVEWIEPEELGDYDSLLRGAIGRRLAGGLWFPDEAQVQAYKLVQALALAGARQGVRFLEGAAVTGLEVTESRVTEALISGSKLSAEAFVVTAGVGSAPIARSAGIEVPVGPVKGQVVHLRTLDRTPEHILWSGHCYVVPRPGGEVIIGATEEDGNGDPRPTLAGVGRLVTEALDFIPTLGSYQFEAVHAGLRPASPDRYPIIGRAPALQNLFVATAHFRGGILLGPLTGSLIARMLDQVDDQSDLPAEVRPFGPDRFASVAV
jgi:glycine oxidase